MNLFLFLLLGTALADETPWGKREIDPKARVIGTAYTVEKYGWRIGPLTQSFGLLDNLEIGTQLVPFALGAPNVQGKVTAIQLPRFDVAVDAGVYFVELGRFSDVLGFEDDFDARLVAPRVGWRGSWAISKRFSLHFGTALYVFDASGEVGVTDLATAVATFAGADIEEELREVLDENTDALADVRLALPQTRFSVDFRFNRRHSLILTSHGFPLLRAQLNAGAETEASDGTVVVEGGAYASAAGPLPETFGTLTTLSWRFDWRRGNLRLGIPLNPTSALAWTQAFDINLMFGRSRSKRPPGYRDSVEVEDASQLPE